MNAPTKDNMPAPMQPQYDVQQRQPQGGIVRPGTASSDRMRGKPFEAVPGSVVKS